MKGITIIVILGIGITRAQLNYEGNPLTENTEYTAEESEFSSKVVKPSISELQKLYPIFRESKDVISKDTKFEKDEPDRQVSLNNFDHAEISALVNVASAREFPDNVYNKVQQPQILQPVTNTVKTPAEIALDTFLNSKTPEESRLSLDYFLQNSQSQNDQSPTLDTIVPQNQQQQQQIQFVSQNNQQMQQQLVKTTPQVIEQVSSYPQINQQQQQLVPTPVQKQVLVQPQNVLQPGPTYGYTAHYTANSQILQPSQNGQTSPVILNPTQQSSLLPDPLEVIKSKNDIVTPMMWRQRNRWIRGQPYPFVQSRIGGVISKGPIVAPFPRKGPVELIYTKPPGYHHPGVSPGQPSADANVWFPDANNPPPSGDVYYSQLYAQSYDPNYYNYIAKTGKIKPHLYGKLGKYPEHEDGGIWTDLYHGFTKHGLKNIMTPGFLLGMTLPMITVMLMALVQKRSLGRYDSSRNLQDGDHFQEYLQRLQRAMECYERKRRKTGDVTTDEC